MKLVFDGMAELRAFLAEIDGDGSYDAAENATGTKRQRRTKAQIAADEAAKAGAVAGFQPPPVANTMAPAPGGTVGFVAPAGATGFPLAPPAAAPVNPLVAQIIAVCEKGIASGQRVDDVLAWFRTTLGPETAQATWDQIKTSYLPKCSDAFLASIAPQFGIPPAPAA